MVKTQSEIEWARNFIFNDLHNCGCGLYEDRIYLLRDVLRACPLYQEPKLDYLNTPLGEWFLALLDSAKLIEHGTAIGGSWLTIKGTRLLDVLNDEEAFKYILK